LFEAERRVAKQVKNHSGALAAVDAVQFSHEYVNVFLRGQPSRLRKINNASTKLMETTSKTTKVACAKQDDFLLAIVSLYRGDVPCEIILGVSTGLEAPVNGFNERAD
jgi:hypothetical protein